MSTETLLIQAVEPKTTKDGKTYHRFQAGEKWYSCWVFGAAGVKAGQTWTVETEQKGNFWNITKLISQETAPLAASLPDAPETRDATRASIEHQVALKAAVELVGVYITAGVNPPIWLWVGMKSLFAMLGGIDTRAVVTEAVRPPGAAQGASQEGGEEDEPY